MAAKTAHQVFVPIPSPFKRWLYAVAPSCSVSHFRNFHPAIFCPLRQDPIPYRCKMNQIDILRIMQLITPKKLICLMNF